MDSKMKSPCKTALIYIYVLYLNWKQSKVSDQMQELISEVKKIRKQLPKKK